MIIRSQQEMQMSQHKFDHEEILHKIKELKERKMEAMMLEFVEVEDGKLVLRNSNEQEEPLISIEFSDKVKQMLGGETHIIGHSMIHAAIQTFMHKQMANYHAHVYDEEPANYS